MVKSHYSAKLNVDRGNLPIREDEGKKVGSKRSGTTSCGKNCKLKWAEDINNERFTLQEEEMIIRLHAAIGSRWNVIAQQLSGKTDNDVKNYWNTTLRKKLKEMGIDPVTHRPFTQILADYRKIGGTPRARTRMIGTTLINNQDSRPNPLLITANNQSQQPYYTTISDNPIIIDHDYYNNNNYNSSNIVSPCELAVEQTLGSPEAFNNEEAIEFGWHDFLVDDVFTQASTNNVDDGLVNELSNSINPLLSQMQSKINHDLNYAIEGIRVSPSFVDDMLLGEDFILLKSCLDYGDGDLAENVAKQLEKVIDKAEMAPKDVIEELTKALKGEVREENGKGGNNEIGEMRRRGGTRDKTSRKLDDMD
ncbi:transcription factor MYB35-like [Impatiens glandulifera]|uniref:transcription factor MYB35-like n=1 Tax=Impatiens glandulifera TaxID=253017 RepID=UPI001FB0B232|nr:transcription factor MYB35-like [Impatiens glandulifera]